MAQPQQQNTVVEHGRQPCPDRILDDIGGAFGMGAVGGGIWHACKGFIASPTSYKVKGTIEEDPFNAIAAGALTGGFLQLRAGPRHALRSAAFGGVLLALIEGLGIALQKMTAPPPPGSPFPTMAGMPGPPGPPGSPAPADVGLPTSGFEASSSGQASADSKGFWSWFTPGGSEKPAEDSKTQTFTEDFTAPPAMPDFKSDEFKVYK